MYRKSFLPFWFCAQAWAISFLLVAASSAQNTSDTGQTEDGYKLIGTVVNSVTGEPIGRALAQIYVGNRSAVLTDSEGKFEFEGLPEGQTEVVARKPGFFSQREINGTPSPNESITIGPDTPPVVLKLIPEAVIFGRIESNGEPVENIPVTLFTRRIREGTAHWDQAGGTSSDVDGQFRIANLQSGTYYLLAGGAWGRGAELRAGAKKEGYKDIFYNNADDFSGATPIEISEGQQTEINFSLKRVSLFHVSGTISGPQGQGINLTFTGPSGVASQLPTHFNPSTGEFETMVPGGTYTLKAQSYNQNGDGMSASLPIQVSSDLAGIRLVLTPAISIPIDVRAENVAPAQASLNFSVGPVTTTDRRTGRQITRNYSDGSMVFVRLHSRAASVQNQEIAASYRVNNEGTPQLQIANVEAGRYAVTFPLNSRWYVQSAQCGGVDLLREDLVIAPGSQPPAIEIVTRNDSATLTGSVSFGGGQSQAEVLVIPNGAPTQTKAISVRVQDHFELDGLAPGDYSVLAISSTHDLEYTNPEVIASYLVHAQHVSLQPNRKSEVNLELVQAGKQ